ncbi:exo-beta-1,3-glucanase [Aquisphaera insulae]|uniref:exo-beta-1,3-glucanase n=1 Tax=Aquisphaera insulae TaxID=2712864 RepID=UPI0013ECE6D0|nr:exo-beta-1,3-glucanase [Aquisphaera insulae]
MRCRVALVLPILLVALSSRTAADEPPLYAYLGGTPAASMVGYTPSELDPRQEANQKKLATSSIRADLEALRPAFDGLVLYGYNEGCTPRIVGLAVELKFRAVLLAIWDPKSAAELDGVAELARLYEKDLALGVIVGNEGLTFGRYEPDDLALAARRLRKTLPGAVPIGTSEPLGAYAKGEWKLTSYGDFLAPNVHPAFDRKELGPAEAAAWVRGEAISLAARSGKPVIVKETGFPHAGREGFTPETQAAFWAAYLAPGRVARPPAASSPTARVFHGVAFESFDLPWKSEASGLVIEQSWGLLSARRRPYPAFGVWKPGSGR